MSRIRIVGELPFVSAILHVNDRNLELPNVLIDTGSAGTVLRTDDLETIGVTLGPEDQLRYMRGIGGLEPVVEKYIDRLEVAELHVIRFRIQLGALDYGISMNGIIGADFLRATGARIDFQKLTIGK